jgi:hypothetical protein
LGADILNVTRGTTVFQGSEENEYSTVLKSENSPAGTMLEGSSTIVKSFNSMSVYEDTTKQSSNQRNTFMNYIQDLPPPPQAAQIRCVYGK